MPGGDAPLYAMFDECRDNIEQFLQRGGLYVGSCGGFNYLSSLTHNMQNDTAIAYDMVRTALNVIPSAAGPVFDLGHISPLEGQQPPVGGAYEPGPSVLAELSDGRIGGYGGGLPATSLPHDAEVLQRFSQVKGEPAASVHIHGKGRNVLAFVYHPEYELGLPTDPAAETGLYIRQVTQPNDNRSLPMLQFQMWRYFAGRLLRAMDVAQLPVRSAVTVPSSLRYQNPKTGVWWKMIEGQSELIPETPLNAFFI